MQNESSAREKTVRSKKTWRVTLVLYDMQKSVGIGNTKMRGSRETILSVEMLHSMGLCQKPEGFTE